MSGRVFLGRPSTNQGIKCLGQGHNALSPVRLEPATCTAIASQVVAQKNTERGDASDDHPPGPRNRLDMYKNCWLGRTASNQNNVPESVAQSVTCLATDACLTADHEVASSSIDPGPVHYRPSICPCRIRVENALKTHVKRISFPTRISKIQSKPTIYMR